MVVIEAGFRARINLYLITSSGPSDVLGHGGKEKKWTLPVGFLIILREPTPNGILKPAEVDLETCAETVGFLTIIREPTPKWILKPT